MSKILVKNIANLFNEYQDYSKFLGKRQEELLNKKKEIAKILLESEDDSEDVEEIVFDIFLDIEIFKNDLNILFNNLSNSVSLYLLDPDFEALPEEVLKVCKEYSHILPKKTYTIGENLIPVEVEKGSIEKIKKAAKDGGTLKMLITQLKTLVKEG